MDLNSTSMNSTILGTTSNFVSGINLTILFGILIALLVMGIAFLYDNYKAKNKISLKLRKPKFSLSLNKKFKNTESFNIDQKIEPQQEKIDTADDPLMKLNTTTSMRGNDSIPSNTSSIFTANGHDNNSLPEAYPKETNSADKYDSLLDSLKNDIIISREKRINFMTNMQDENLDLKVITSELEALVKQLKKYKRYSNYP